MNTLLLLLALTAAPADPAQDALVRALAARGIVYKHDARCAAEATGYAQTLANKGRQDGHQGFGQRAARLGGNVREVSAESWPGQSVEAAAKECVHSWSQSPGHWRSLKKGGAGGFGMRRGRNGTWYGVGIMR